MWLLLFHQTPHITKRVLHLTNIDPVNAAYRTTVHLAAVILKIDNRLLQMRNPPIGDLTASTVRALFIRWVQAHPGGIYQKAAVPVILENQRGIKEITVLSLSLSDVRHERNLQDNPAQPASARRDLTCRNAAITHFIVWKQEIFLVSLCRFQMSFALRPLQDSPEEGIICFS